MTVRDDKTKKIEETLRGAFASVTPQGDIDRVLAACGNREGSKIVMMEDKRGRILRRVGAIAAAFALVLGGALAIRAYDVNCRVDTTVSLDVNPSIEITANQKEKVLAVNALNADAETVLDGMTLDGEPIDAAVNALVEAMLADGYLVPNDGAILVTVEGKNETRAAAVETKVKAALANAPVAVTAQMLGADDALLALAAQYGITAGKAKYVEGLVAAHPEKSFAELAALDMRELWRLEAGAEKVHEIALGVDEFVGGLSAEQIADGAFAYIEKMNARNKVPFDRNAIRNWSAEPVIWADEPYYSVSFENDTHYYHCYVEMSTGRGTAYTCVNWLYEAAMSDENKAALLERAKADAGFPDATVSSGSIKLGFSDIRTDSAHGEERVFLTFRNEDTRKTYIYCFGVRTGKIYLREQTQSLRVEEGFPLPAPVYGDDGWVTRESAIEIALAALGLTGDNATVQSVSGLGFSKNSGKESRHTVSLHENTMDKHYQVYVGVKTGMVYTDEITERPCLPNDDAMYHKIWAEQNPENINYISQTKCEQTALRKALLDTDFSQSDVTVTASVMIIHEEHVCWKLEFDAHGRHYKYFFDMLNDYAVYKKTVTPLG